MAAHEKGSPSNSETEVVQDQADGDLWDRLNADLKTAKKETSALKKALKRAEEQLERVNRYNDDLRIQVEKLNKKARKYKRAAKYAEKKAKKKAKDKCHVGVQVDNEQIDLEASHSGIHQTEDGVVPPDVDQVTSTTEAAEKAGQDWRKSQGEGDAPLSIADSIRSAAEEVMESTGFVYDEATGLYFDHNSGYYYDSENSLYYDPTTGIYTYFDEQTQTYEFHSQVDLKQLENRMYPNRKERLRAKKKRKRENNEQSTEIPKKCEKDDQNEASETKSGKECKKKKKKKSCEVTKGKRKDKTDKEEVAKKVKTENVKTQKLDMFDVGDENKSDKIDAMSEIDANVPTILEGKKILESSCAELADPDDKSENQQKDSTKDDAIKENESSSDMEEGELSDSESGEAESSDEESEEEIVKEWPPCIRAMVTKSDFLEEGTLFVITCTGATVGREQNLGHAILIEDPQISKMHCDIHYDEEKKTYMIKDHASQNGTFLNSKRISKVKMMGEDTPLKHKDALQIGTTTIELHIHPGTDTCNACEPGLVQAELMAAKPKEIVITSKADVEKQRRAQLKGIKNKYGLGNSTYVDNKAAISNPKYTDKSAVRRKEKGSDNPYEPDAQPASVLRPISTENKGHKLLMKMGWAEGESLGKSQQGLQEPIHVLARGGSNAGLGARGPSATMDNVDSLKTNEKWFKAQQRFANMQGTAMDTTASVVNKPEAKKATFTKFVQGQTVKFNLSTKVKDIQNPLGTNEEDSDEVEENT